MRSPTEYWRQRAGLREGTDIAGTDARIREGASLSPENLWLVACSALLASIGLDQDSAAVIIGAMLISPLMGPILAVGLALGTEDRDLLDRSARELAVASVAGLVLSAAYFWLSPLAQPTGQLASRTHPTLLDVGVALFGGVAGIVAGSRRVPSLALPGVAIATALMPPLCTAGFGLATGQPGYFFGALYLYLLNAIFIALATMLVVRWLHFPPRTFVDAEVRRRAHRVMAGVIIVVAAPSLYFLYRSGVDTRERQRVEGFLREHVHGVDREVIRWDIVAGDSGRVLKVYVTGHPIQRDSAAAFARLLPSRGLRGLGLQFVQSELSASDVARLRTDAVQGVLQALEKSRVVGDSVLGAMAARNARVRQASRELASAFPEISEVAFAELPDALGSPESAAHPALLITFRPRTARADVARLLARARAFLRERLPADSLDARQR